MSFGYPTDLRRGNQRRRHPAARASATAQELTQYCQARLAAFEVPKRFCFVTSLPRTAKESDDRRQLAITLRAEAMNLARTTPEARDECPVPEFLFTVERPALERQLGAIRSAHRRGPADEHAYITARSASGA